MTQRDFYTLRELARRWDTTQAAIHKLISDGKLAAFRVGDRPIDLRVRVATVATYEAGTSATTSHSGDAVKPAE